MTTGKGGFFGVSNVTYGINIAINNYVVKRKMAFRFPFLALWWLFLTKCLIYKGFSRKRNFALCVDCVSDGSVEKAK